MAEDSNSVTIDFAEIEKQLAGMSPEQLRQALLDVKVKQRVTTKSYYNPETAKKARLKKQALINAMVEAAQKAGIYQQILDEAREKADEILAAKAADEDGGGVEA